MNRLVGSGATLNADLVSQKIKRWMGRWENHNALSGYVILEKGSNDFVGQIILKPVKDKTKAEHSFIPNMIEIGYLSVEKHWKKGYWKEYTHAILNHLVPLLIKHQFQVHQTPIQTIMATARCDNEGSNKILNFFMNFIEEKERYGGPRMWYKYDYFEKDAKNEPI